MNVDKKVNVDRSPQSEFTTAHNFVGFFYLCLCMYLCDVRDFTCSYCVSNYFKVDLSTVSRINFSFAFHFHHLKGLTMIDVRNDQFKIHSFILSYSNMFGRLTTYLNHFSIFLDVVF